jgi:predicted flap endonuclease-1-like 5' DNA nuclease
MEINTISSNAPTPPSTTPAVSTPAKPKETFPKQDTVTLSGAALAKSLKQSGMSAAQIAQRMHLDIKTVDQYLGIATNAVTTPTMPSTAAPQVKQAS